MVLRCVARSHSLILLQLVVQWSALVETTQSPQMAAFSAAAVAIPSFIGVKLECSKVALDKISSYTRSRANASVRASMRENVGKMGTALLAASASVVIASNAAEAKAVEVLMGGSGGELAFIPSEFQVAAGETIVFKNNAGFPHNVIFDDEEVPEGVDVSAISMPEEELLNAPGQTYKVTLDKKGTYRFYCAPHQGTGMSGKVVVN